MTDDKKPKAEKPVPTTNDNQPKPTLRQRCRNAFQNVSRRDVVGVVKHTAKDLKSLKEISMLATATFIPGGWVGYGAYRINQYRKKMNDELAKGDNDNMPQAAEAPVVTAKPAKKSKKFFKGPKA